jgi:sialate O-acetylesterase
MKLLSITITGIVFAACIVSSHAAEVTLPEIYADHMVIQTDEPIIVSGTVSPTSAELEIKLAGQTVSVTPRLFGGWTATLDPVSEVGGSHTLTISAEGEVAHTIEDITFGDVWLCGGQSNMAWDMTTINDSAAEIASADFPDIRLMEVSLRTSSKPLAEVKEIDQDWTRCSPTAVRRFSAVGYLFGRELYQKTGRPIGLIQSAWGGSRIETWIPDTALQGSPYTDNIAGRNFGQQQHKPSICYNAMIHGLAPLALKGVIWYQGENNQTHPEEYRSLMETWIDSWRDLWQAPELPFYYVQLANYAPGQDWELLREAQTQTLAISNTGMAVTIDIGASNDIHPRNKQGTATRLAAIALAKTYGQDRVYSGPLLKAAESDGHNITLRFDHVGSGLASAEGLAGFQVLTAEGRWSKGNAKIVGDTVEIPGTLFRTNPQGVRYGWDSDPVISLSNKEGFPAVPFRFESLDQVYASWRDQLVGAERRPNEDADGDSVSNLMQYATAHRDPRMVTSSNGRAELSFHRRANALDVTIAVEQSGDLETWTEIWSSGQPDSSGFAWSQERAWGASMTDRYAITLPTDAKTSMLYRIRYGLSEDDL